MSEPCEDEEEKATTNELQRRNEKHTTKHKSSRPTRTKKKKQTTAPPPPKKRRGRPSIKTSKSSSKSKVSKYGPVKDRTCPLCNKVFSIVSGLAYHLDNKVCIKKKEAEKVKGEVDRKKQPFYKLEPGDSFVTELGVMRVILDGRIPDDFGLTIVDKSSKDQFKEWKKKMDRQEKLRNRVIADGHPVPDKLLDDLGGNPMEPKDSYPDRIVECEQIIDERIIYDEIDVLEGKHKIDCDQVILDAKQMNDSKCNIVDVNKEIGSKASESRFYLRRRMLFKKYNPDSKEYKCSICGKGGFNSTPGLNYHIATHPKPREVPFAVEIEDGDSRPSKRRAACKAEKKTAQIVTNEDNAFKDQNVGDNLTNEDNEDFKEETIFDDDNFIDSNLKKTFVQVAKKRPPEDVHIQEIVDSVNTGRYFTMKKYDGEHDNFCKLCRRSYGKLYNCEFCKQANHIECLMREMTIVEWSKKSDFCCGGCIRVVLGRRRRAARRFAKAEKRREQEKIHKDQLKEKADEGDNEAKIELEKIEEKAKPKKRQVSDQKKEATPKQSNASSQPAKAKRRKKGPTPCNSDVPGNSIGWDKSFLDSNIAPCPEGGPGGLVCCAVCAESYSTLLNETTEEMDMKTVAKIGEEVNELVELLNDAKKRLKIAMRVAKDNIKRRCSNDIGLTTIDCVAPKLESTYLNSTLVPNETNGSPTVDVGFGSVTKDNEQVENKIDVDIDGNVKGDVFYV